MGKGGTEGSLEKDHSQLSKREGVGFWEGGRKEERGEGFVQRKVRLTCAPGS